MRWRMYKALLATLLLMFTPLTGSTADGQLIPALASSVHASDQFSELHEALDRTADDILANTIHQMVDAADGDRGNVRPYSPESLVREFDQKYHPNLSPNVAAAFGRLDQL